MRAFTFKLGLFLYISPPVSDNGKYLTIWQQQPDGSLKMKIDIWNTDLYPRNLIKLIAHFELRSMQLDKVK